MLIRLFSRTELTVVLRHSFKRDTSSLCNYLLVFALSATSELLYSNAYYVLLSHQSGRNIDQTCTCIVNTLKERDCFYSGVAVGYCLIKGISKELEICFPKSPLLLLVYLLSTSAAISRLLII